MICLCGSDMVTESDPITNSQFNICLKCGDAIPEDGE